jgi:hypothetical protein
MGKKGREYVVENYTENVVTEKLFSVYRENGVEI